MAWDALATLVTGILGFLLDYAVHRRERIAAYQASIFEAELSAYKELWEFGFLCCKKYSQMQYANGIGVNGLHPA